ncbi:hypothetical protein HS041_12095 [Planomonospora sp. ID67723]|uniref:hypothetical protein n=1 Tax=Planomonospora sp. ID67723 TaxID=2738134 RepID=UPI0018C3D45B|nr:hypothetical protein [Planomonospora sp. ID67723]MBG0828509.1 hypothetical protein [Planomonospora sp. ID67723]
MSLPTFDEADARAREGSPFSNGTEGYTWMGNWCGRCVHDAPARRDDYANACPLILVALTGKTPAEWLESDPYSLADRYQCLMFRPEDDPGPDEPTPVPDPPGQLTLCPREPYERPARMFVDTLREAADVS